MKKLKSLISQYGRWAPLDEYILRIETYIHKDFGFALENSKSILESIAKEICTSQGVELGSTESISGALKKACKAIGYNGSDLVTQLSTAIANIGHQMGNLRNEIGSTSHGRTMEELKLRNNGLDEITKDFLIDTTEMVACFLIKNFENEHPRKKVESELINYLENDDFNNFWDDEYGEFSMGDYSYTASEIFYNVDYQAYKSEYSTYSQNPKEDEDEI